MEGPTLQHVLELPQCRLLGTSHRVAGGPERPRWGRQEKMRLPGGGTHSHPNLGLGPGAHQFLVLASAPLL